MDEGLTTDTAMSSGELSDKDEKQSPQVESGILSSEEEETSVQAGSVSFAESEMPIDRLAESSMRDLKQDQMQFKSQQQDKFFRVASFDKVGRSQEDDTEFVSTANANAENEE